MKKIMLFILILLCACSPVILQPSIPTATVQPNTCILVQLKTWDELGKKPDGSFGQDGSYPSANLYDPPSVNNRMTLGKTEIDLLISKNKNIDGTWIYKDWNWVVPVSPRPFDRNTVCVDVFLGNFAHIVAASKMVSYDSIKDISWLNYKVSANYRVGTAQNNWNSGEYLWNGFLFAPDDGSGFPTTKGNHGFWMSSNDIYSNSHQSVAIPWLQSGTQTSTYTPTATSTITPTPVITTTPVSNAITVYISDFGFYDNGEQKGLNIRPDASMNNIRVGNYYPFTPVSVIVYEDASGNCWGEIMGQTNQWIAIRLKGKWYVSQTTTVTQYCK